MANQLSRSGTSVGANYRACGPARSQAEFVSKLAIAEEEADETCYWLEIIMDAKLVKPDRVESLYEEAESVLKTIASSRKTARSGKE